MVEKKSGKLWTALDRQVNKPPPIWLMRQAGRYLPEYREARARAGSFWDLCMSSLAAAEVSLQPVRRFGLDAAIIFSDILVVPYALGKKVAFEDGSGPRLECTVSVDELHREREEWERKLAPVYAALGYVAGELGPDTDLIGFAGAPWTLAAYMTAGQSSADQREAKLWASRDRDGFAELLRIIGECVAWHLSAQVKAGATVLQIFDSWAGGLSERDFADWVVAPTRTIVDQVRKSSSHVKIIGFPRGATQHGYERYAISTGVDAVSLDSAVPIFWAAQTLASRVTLQGNIDPVVLVAGGSALKEQTAALLGATRTIPFVANLGHGVLPQTPVEHVAEFVSQVRAAR